jgi:hypothetical protein
MPTPRRFLLAILVASSAVFGGGVATALADNPPPGDIPDNQAFVTFSGKGYSLKTPEGWARTARGTAVTFADKFNSIRVETATAGAKPTVASVKQHDVAALKAAAKGFTLRSVTSVTRSAGPLILMTYRAASAPDSVTGKSITQDIERYSYWKAGRLATVTLAAPKGSDNVDAWKLVTNSFRWTR